MLSIQWRLAGHPPSNLRAPTLNGEEDELVEVFIARVAGSGLYLPIYVPLSGTIECNVTHQATTSEGIREVDKLPCLDAESR